MKLMKKFAIAISLIVSALPALASIGSGSVGAVVVVAVPAPKTVALALAMPADFVSVPIKVISDQKNSALAYEESGTVSGQVARTDCAGNQANARSHLRQRKHQGGRSREF